MPNLVPNTTTNGVVSAGVIGTLIDAVNGMGAWLQEVGYQNSTVGPFIMSYWRRGKTEPTVVQKSLDDAAITACWLPGATLKKDNTSHGTVTYTAPNGLIIKTVTATPITDQPCFITIDSSPDGSAVTFNVHTSAKAAKTEKIILHVIAFCWETSSDADTA